MAREIRNVLSMGQARLCPPYESIRARRVLVSTIALAVGLVAGAAPLSAETYPARPVKIIVSTSPGGITDIAARILGAHVTDGSNQPVVIDNRAGASGNIAM